MSDAKIITVAVEYEDATPGNTIDRGTEHFWAVQPPQDTGSYITEDGVEHTYSVLGPVGFRLMGSHDVVVYNKQSVQGLRMLLDAVEKELDE